MRSQNLKTYKNPSNLRGRNIFIVQLWYVIRCFLFRPSPRFANSWRVFILEIFGAKIGKSVIIRPSAKIEYPWKIEIGDYTWIGEDTYLYSLGHIQIGSNAVISQKSYLCTGTHDYLSENFDIKTASITIGDQCWIASDVFIGPGVSIPSKCVIGARSSVFKTPSIPGIYLGNPAKLAKPF